MVAAALALTTGLALAPRAGASTPAAATVTGSPLGFVGCVDPGFTPGVTTVDYCFVAQRLTGGAQSGQLSVRAWTYAHSLPGRVLTDEETVVAASALQAGEDGSFTFSPTLPRMGAVSIVGVGANVRSIESQDEGNTSFPLTYALASAASALTPYDSGHGPNHMQSGTVNGQRQVELQGAVWTGPASGGWQMAGIL